MLTWRKLNDKLALMSEEDVLALLNEERATTKRISVLARLHKKSLMMLPNSNLKPSTWAS